MTDVRQNPALSRFELDVDGHTAFASYRQAGDVMMMTHTETPPALRERGIGERLVLGSCNRSVVRGSRYGLYARSCGLCYRSTPNFTT